MSAKKRTIDDLFTELEHLLDECYCLLSDAFELLHEGELELEAAKNQGT